MFHDINILALILTIGVIMSVLQRFLFNILSKHPMPIDNWVIFDILCSIMNLVCYFATNNLTPETVLDTEKKSQIDQYVVVTIVL
jgi:hypothetical protein